MSYKAMLLRRAVMRQAAAFDPNDLNPALFLRADEGVTESGGAVSAWADQSTNGNDFAQATASKQPTLTASVWGSKPGITFDGVDDLLTASAFLNGSAGVVFALFRAPSTLQGNLTILSSADEASNVRYVILRALESGSAPAHQFPRIEQRNNDTADTVHGSTTITADSDHIYVFRSSGTAYNIRIDGADETPAVDGGANGGDWFAGSSARDNTAIGAQKLMAEGGFLKGDLGVVIAFDSDLTATQISDVETWINNWAGGGIL